MTVSTDEYDKFIKSIAKKVVREFDGVHFSEDDLCQRGWIELIKAADRYEKEKGVKFTTYAYKSVEEGIRDEAIFQMNRGGMTGKDKIAPADFVSMDEEKGIAEMISEQRLSALDDGQEDESIGELRTGLKLLTEKEKKVLYAMYGIGCERCSSAKKIAGLSGMRELEVKKLQESGKRKLRELLDGRK